MWITLRAISSVARRPVASRTIDAVTCYVQDLLLDALLRAAEHAPEAGAGRCGATSEHLASVERGRNVSLEVLADDAASNAAYPAPGKDRNLSLVLLILTTDSLTGTSPCCFSSW